MGQDNCKPQPGDLIEIYRTGYRHWALYVGNGYVIHLTDQGTPCSSGSIASILSARAMVKKELLIEVAGSDKWKVNNKYDRYHTPFSVKEIIQRAEKWVGREVEYDVFTNNCEHFVTRLRYGVGLCEQVENVAVGGTAAAIGGLLSATSALAMLALSRR